MNCMTFNLMELRIILTLADRIHIADAVVHEEAGFDSRNHILRRRGWRSGLVYRKCPLECLIQMDGGDHAIAELFINTYRRLRR